MAPRRVIEDSDEDDGSLYTPERMSPYTNTAEMANTLASSTDPTLFRAVYEEHLGQPPVYDEHPQSPIFEDNIVNQHMTSSSSAPSARKLKRSKTINISSLTSVSEPTILNRKAKRAKSMKGAEDLTQVTTPRKSRDATRDPWEVPTSSASDRPADMNLRVKSRNAERNHSLKTYGRPIRRTHTVAHATHSQSSDRRLSSPLEDDVAQIASHKRPVRSLEDDELLPMLPKTKRHKTRPSENLDLPKRVIRALPTSVSEHQDALSESTDLISMGAESLPIQVQRSTDENPHVGTKDLVTIHTHQGSALSAAIQATTDTTVRDSYPVSKSSSSIVNISKTLMTDQKLQYDAVSKASVVQSQRSSLPEMMEKIDPNMKYTGDSSTVPNDTPSPKLPSEIIEASAHTELLSSSPPISAMNRKMKRAKSEVGLRQLASSAAASSQNKVTKRKGRSKTIATGEKLPHCEASVDELSPTSLEFAGKNISKIAIAKSVRKRARGQDEEDQISGDDLHSPGETDLEGKQYLSRSSLCRSKSIPVQTPKEVVDLSLSKTKVARKKSSKATYTLTHSIPGDMEPSTETPAQVTTIQIEPTTTTSVYDKADAENQACQIETIMSENVRNFQNTTETPANVPVSENVSTVPVQPKKRGRPKKSDVMSDKAPGVPNPQSTEVVLAISKENEVQRNVLCEADSNKQPSQELAGAPPTKMNPTASIAPPQQTPTKEAKKGPDQHSPLQSGKVPYRVGLSKRTRIAPLLKIIRK